MEADERFMQLALAEAIKSEGRTSPNPLVGALIVRDGKVLAQGYHQRAGMPHAEIEAINKVEEPLKGATMYVTLEPCSHTGKTPPCCEALVREGFERVVIGMEDPNPLVSGRGIAYLHNHGIKTRCGVLEQKCRAINYPFIKYITKGTPWTIMKAGLSLDGRLNYQRNQRGWITGEESSNEVHRIRDKVDAILVGYNTLQIDNPSLTTRCSGRESHDPVRIILDSTLRSDTARKVFHLASPAPTWVVCREGVDSVQKGKFRQVGAEVIEVGAGQGRIDLNLLLKILGSRGICSLLVEGGAGIHGSFLRERLYDYAYLFYAPIFAGDGGVGLLEQFTGKSREKVPEIVNPEFRRFGEDFLMEGKIMYPPMR